MALLVVSYDGCLLKDHLQHSLKRHRLRATQTVRHKVMALLQVPLQGFQGPSLTGARAKLIPLLHSRISALGREALEEEKQRNKIIPVPETPLQNKGRIPPPWLSSCRSQCKEEGIFP